MSKAQNGTYDAQVGVRTFRLHYLYTVTDDKQVMVTLTQASRAQLENNARMDPRALHARVEEILQEIRAKHQ